MVLPKLLSNTLSLSLLTLGLTFSHQFPGQAQFAADDLIINFQPPGGNPEGGNSDGGSRGEDSYFCDLEDPPINFTPLLPANKYVTTTNPNPKIYIYVPPTEITGFDVELYRQQEDTWIPLKTLNGFDHEAVAVSYQDGGIFSLDLSNFEDLEPGEIYRWQLTVNCQRNGVMKYSVYPASVEAETYIYPTIAMVDGDKLDHSSFESAQPSLYQAARYAQQGLWLETVDTLAQLKQANSNDELLDDQWSNLLNSPHAELGSLVNKPIRATEEWQLAQPEDELDLFDNLFFDEEQPGIVIEDPVIVSP